jgi:hypothetical protein
MLGRWMTPVEGGDRHFLFRADADLCIIVEARDEIDIEGRIGRRPDLMDDGPELFAGREAHADGPDPATSADPEGEVGCAASEGHASTRERMAAAEALRHTCRDATHITQQFPR